jgi:L-2-hydroxyglutarate oxidase
MAKKYWKTGLNEFQRSLNKSAFTKELKRLLPELCEQDLIPGNSGVRAQALDPDGNLADDFRIIETENMIHVVNAPSPAATAS